MAVRTDRVAELLVGAVAVNATEKAMKHVRWLWQIAEWLQLLRELPERAGEIRRQRDEARRANGA